MEAAEADDAADEAEAAAEQPDSDDERAMVPDSVAAGGADEKARKAHSRWREQADEALEEHITANVMQRQREEEEARRSRMRRLMKRLARQHAADGSDDSSSSAGAPLDDRAEPGDGLPELEVTQELINHRAKEERRKRRRVTVPHRLSQLLSRD